MFQFSKKTSRKIGNLPPESADMIVYRIFVMDKKTKTHTEEDLHSV